jgi:hypothetical protein
MAWVLITFIAKTYDVSFLVLLLLLGLLVPAIIALSIALYWMQRQRLAVPLGLRSFHPAVALLVVLVWFWVSLVLASDPGEDIGTLVIRLTFTFGLALAWLAVLGVAIQTLVASRWKWARRTLWITVYVIPLPVAVYLGVLLVDQEDLLLRARFELSESALSDDVSEPQRGSHRVGLFQVNRVYPEAGCVFLETHGTVGEAGFAYCTGHLPQRTSPPSITMEHLKDLWWKYQRPWLNGGSGGAD